MRDPNLQCNLGKSFVVECNNCGCGDDGKASWCTRASCEGQAWKKIVNEKSFC